MAVLAAGPIAPSLALPIENRNDLFNLKEFTHLAAILPSVYAEEKDNW